MARAKSFKTLVRDLLKGIGTDQRYLAKIWGESQTIYDPVTRDGKVTGTVWRKRREDERIENRLEKTIELYSIASRIEVEAREIKALAAQRYGELNQRATPGHVA